MDIIEQLAVAIDPDYRDFANYDERQLKEFGCINLVIGRVVMHPGYALLLQAAYPDSDFLALYPEVKPLDSVALRQLVIQVTLHLGQCSGCNEKIQQQQHELELMTGEEAINKLLEGMGLRANKVRSCSTCEETLAPDDQFCRFCGQQNTEFNEAGVLNPDIVATEREDCITEHWLAKSSQGDFPNQHHCPRCGVRLW